ncbi:MAG: glycerophosphodiester phosphodiesterase family protein [Lentisphaerae bacterium]|nr:glycerophosphodiester phosphodiesterase family protein [Lentisphaerota bacterium]MBT4820097.1 glycerophosphodiester phosphodiesterase family protein [Lentisphaerota bacterium]MBT5605739.1 glycerophosphodiester phosphodiesterase family protein [Lentisphaerota bacterium]MBT7053938.1 glycerophosphodiester phosphodiesterase family protein [Lentisphaerota bacterium]MBT7843920.1 glycerophosphodiester phosphodiesterase family protein [Lentisphaerota bacterium]
MREYLSGLVVAIDSPSGSRTKTLPLDPQQDAAGPIWVNRGAETGVWTLLLLENDAPLRTFCYNAWHELPEAVGVCAHRGDNRVAPENTLAAIASAVAKGAHQIEIDLTSSRDGQLVLLHDLTLDRTTNGTGKPGDYTFAELRKLDAGAWKGEKWKGGKIPTFREALEAIPQWIQVNCHLKGGIGGAATREIVAMERLDQCFLACGRGDAAAARKVDPRIRICNMSGQRGADSAYPDQTIAMRAQYLQLKGWSDCTPRVCDKLRRHGVTINYYGTSDPVMFRKLIEAGVQYPLTDNLDAMLEVLKVMGIPPATAPLAR